MQVGNRLVFTLTGIIFCCLQSLSQQNPPLKIGDAVPNFPTPFLLNTEKSYASFQAFQQEITVIDFFGTWCVPCRRALPELVKLSERYPDQLSIILISIEEEAQLKKFLTKKPAGNIPLIIDAEEKISRLFQPPSYPYTVVLDKNGRIMAIETGGDLNEEKISAMLAGTYSVSTNDSRSSTNSNNFNVERSSNELVKLSQDFIYTEKTDGETAALQQSLADLSLSQLDEKLGNDAEKKAFWINIYNGYTQALLKANPDQYKKRNKFFKSRQINLAGEKLSLDKIEHGFLRRSSLKWSLGHVQKWFPSKAEKLLRVDTVDYRIHFALNCGAKSCPPIAFYQPESLDQQLNLATANFLRNETVYDKERNLIELPAIMGWFRGDFDGKKGMLRLLEQYELIPPGSNPKIRFKKYNWDIELSNYAK